MSHKFKIGDRVEYIARDEDAICQDGRIGAIGAVERGLVEVKWEDGSERCHPPFYLKKIPPKEGDTDAGKAPVMQGLFQFFPRALKEVALHSAYGAKKYEEKYEDKNWSKVENGKNRYGDALSRHILDQFIDGPIDPESKRLHACAIAWNALAYLEKVIEETNND